MTKSPPGFRHSEGLIDDFPFLPKGYVFEEIGRKYDIEDVVVEHQLRRVSRFDIRVEIVLLQHRDRFLDRRLRKILSGGTRAHFEKGQQVLAKTRANIKDAFAAHIAELKEG